MSQQDTQEPTTMTRLSRSLPALITALLLTQTAAAFQAGWQEIRIAGPGADAAATSVALYYPTQAPARTISMGPFTPHVAAGAAPQASVKGLIVLSHGTGGSELGHSRLAEALAEAGYLVAALRHPRDNWQDQSLLAGSPETYFTERPRQVSRVIDAMLRDPQWKDRNLPGADLRRVPNAWHFAFMDTPSVAIATKDGDIAADPPGFDRAAFLKRLGPELAAFFDKSLK